MLPRALREVKVIYRTRLFGMTDKSFQPTLAGLRAFVAVAEKQHFGSAATTLGVSQSTLSQALASLEAGLGTNLVERSTRRVRMTTEGVQLLPLAQAVLVAADAFTSAAVGASDPLQGPIRLGLIPTVAPYVLPTILTGLVRRLPGMTVQVIEDQTERLLTPVARGRGGCGPHCVARRDQRGQSRLRSTTRISCSRCPRDISWQDGVGYPLRHWPGCRCSCWTRVIVCAIRHSRCAARPERGPNSPIRGRLRWLPQCNAWRVDWE